MNPRGNWHSDGKHIYMVDDMWVIAANQPITHIPFKNLKHNLYVNCWGRRRNGVREKVATPAFTTDPKHLARIEKADTTYPIILNPNMYVRDGVHRLCKIARTASDDTLVACVILDNDMLSSVALPLD